jgi:hypothetical protein
MNTFFSMLNQINLIFLQMTTDLSHQPGLQPMKQPVVTGIIPFGKQVFNKMILYPAK